MSLDIKLLSYEHIFDWNLFWFSKSIFSWSKSSHFQESWKTDQHEEKSTLWIMVLSLIIFPKMEWRDHFPLEIYLFPGILSWEMGLKGHISTRGEAECGNQPRKSHFPTKYVWKKVNWKWKKVKLPILGKIIKEIAFFDFNRFFELAECNIKF